MHPQQLVAGCILTKQVTGKTRHPIIEQDTVIKEKHIKVLEHFQIEKVEVSDTLQSGQNFTPENMPITEKTSEPPVQRKSKASFASLYVNTVAYYKEMFKKWQSGSNIEIHHVRQIMNPLFDYINEIHLDLFLLHQFASKKDYFYHHAVSVALLSAYLAKKLGYHKEWKQVGMAGLLADCGMAKLNENWLTKESQLTIAEYEEIKKHSTLSYRMVEDIPFVTQAMKLSILQHHERMDGSGYPIGVTEEKIHPFAKIIAVCDTYHAMTSERFYRRKQSPFKVMAEMLKLKYKKFDFTVLQKFIDSLMNVTIGTRVQLSNKQEAFIIFIDPNIPTRPIVRVIDTEEIINLDEKQAIFIEKIISD
ncbi:HD-GYP domain-containing protein [Gracilibacillus salinarum]|uniref:HD-GYP domain-containing protein n=1 Tax=Gracilibacillus salinarum TaxID=2932255 RepID=A0ABY4GU73_9BACI|nr:HD-GYP domain-containing protein [Gracilibacillus salinarum]UOQ87500.1 HD-GYP domain-containing protein [Gracilibacillus salinarum]